MIVKFPIPGFMCADAPPRPLATWAQTGTSRVTYACDPPYSLPGGGWQEEFMCPCDGDWDALLEGFHCKGM